MKSGWLIFFCTMLLSGIVQANQCSDLFKKNQFFLSTTQVEEAMVELETEFLNTWDIEAAAEIIALKWKATKFEILKTYARHRSRMKESFAKKIYRPTLEFGKHLLTELGQLYRAYFLRQVMDLDFFRWNYVETLHEKGKDENGFGSHSYPGLVQLMTRQQKVTSETIAKSQLKVGAQTGKPWIQGSMVNISAMSYPQLSAHSVMSLMYAHVKLAQAGIRQTFSTGEGGADFHLALLSGSRDEIRQATINYAITANGIKFGSLEHAKIEVYVEELFRRRNELFAEFSPDDLAKAQVVFQIGSGLNGARSSNGTIDFEILQKLSAHPNYAGTQIKLRQAAKEGASVAAKKINPMAAMIRNLKTGSASIAAGSPTNWNTNETLAQTILNIRASTGKPVSIKFAVSDPNEVREMLSYLTTHNSLPDHIQLDGSGWIRQPGSGSAPLMGNTARNIVPATVIVNKILKDLGVRDTIVLESSGDVETPHEAMMLLSMGADVVGSARLWMGMTLGCRRVQRCNSGACPYGITSADDTIMTLGMDPKVIGTRGFLAAKTWQGDFTKALAQSGASDWQGFSKQFPYDDPNNPLKVRTEYDHTSLQILLGEKP